MNVAQRELAIETRKTLNDVESLIDLQKLRAEPRDWLAQVDRYGNSIAAPLLETKAKCLLALATLQGGSK